MPTTYTYVILSLDLKNLKNDDGDRPIFNKQLDEQGWKKMDDVDTVWQRKLDPPSEDLSKIKRETQRQIENACKGTKIKGWVAYVTGSNDSLEKITVDSKEKFNSFKNYVEKKPLPPRL